MFEPELQNIEVSLCQSPPFGKCTPGKLALCIFYFLILLCFTRLVAALSNSSM